MLLTSGLLLLAGCGGSEPPPPAAPQRYGLQLAAPDGVAGLQWAMALNMTDAYQADMSRRAAAALGPDARLMSRPQHMASTEPVLEWAIYAKGSPGSTGWLLMELDTSNAAPLPTIHAVICANAYGNPVPCTLTWVAM